MAMRLLGVGQKYKIVTEQEDQLSKAQLLQIARKVAENAKVDMERGTYRVGWNAEGWWDASDYDGYWQPWGSDTWKFGLK